MAAPADTLGRNHEPSEEETLAELDGVMATLCYPLTVTTTAGNSPAAVGNRIADAVIARGLADGSNEAGGYAATDYKPINDALVGLPEAGPGSGADEGVRLTGVINRASGTGDSCA